MIKNQQNQGNHSKQKDLKDVSDSHIKLTNDKNNQQLKKGDQEPEARSNSKSKLSNHKQENDDKKQNIQKDKSQAEDKDNKDDEQRSDGGSLKRVNVKSLKNSSNLMRKYKERSKNTSRLQGQSEAVNSMKSSTNSFLQKRKHSSSHKQAQENDNKKGDGQGQQKQLQQQNKKLRNKSAFLMQQLKNIQARLNKQLNKRGSPTSKRNFRVHSMESINNRQIQNADKRCKIYQKQIEALKQKSSIFNQQKINQLTDKVQKLQQANIKLEQQRKQYKKSAKHYQKIIDQIGDGDYLKLRQQNEKLKSDNRKLKQKIKKQEQEQRMEKISASNQKSKSKKQQEKKQEERKKQEEKQQKQINILKNKSQRDDKKIKALTFQNNQSKDKMEEYKKQIEEKDKQIQSLKEKIRSMKIINQNLQKQLKKKNGQKQQTDKDKKEGKSKKKSPEKNKMTERSKSKSKGREEGKLTAKSSRIGQRQQSIQKQDKKQKKQVEKSKVNSRASGEHNKKSSKDSNNDKDEEIKDESKEPENQQQQKSRYNKGKYPKKIEKGESNNESYKWNHHAFSSKIKSIQVMPHPNGHIKCLNFRYEKGEPARIQNGTYASFVCDENDGEFIKQVSGGFKAGVLQYIKVSTNKKRQSTFCKHDIAESCDNFSFGAIDNQYPCAFFGENINQSIVRLGCFIQALK